MYVYFSVSISIYKGIKKYADEKIMGFCSAKDSLPILLTINNHKIFHTFMGEPAYIFQTF